MDTNTTSQLPVEEETTDTQQMQRIIEAILFAAGHPIPYAKLADVLKTTPSVIRRTVEEYAA